MARYLTPAKIGLLALIELYTESAVSTSSTIPILSFITSHLLPSSLPKPQNRLQGEPQDDQIKDFVISISDFRVLLSAHASAKIPGRTLWDLFMESLWAINSLDALHQFFESRTNILAKSRELLKKEAEAGLPPPDEAKVLLSRTSPCGAFVRRSQLEFTRLKFHDAMILWKNFIAYRQSTFSLWQKRNPGRDAHPWDAVLSQADEDWGPDARETLALVGYGDLMVGETDDMSSTDDFEKLLEFQIEQMQKLGSRVPEAVRSLFNKLMNDRAVIPSLLHYVKFLDAWRAGDYPTSFDSLHRFFDYTMQNRDRLFYQYALLNLAVLQADFGCYGEAVAAMQETVATARENKDMGCLNFSLSWLHHFQKAHPNIIDEANRTNMLGVEREGLAFLRVKAKETGMWSLWSSSLLSEAKMGLCNGESVATAFENIIRSSQLSVTRNMMNNVGAQMMLQSSLWSRLGNNHLAWSCCEVFLCCHSRHAPFDDILKFTCRTAYILTQRGKFDEGMARLEGLDINSLRSLKANQYWLRFRGILRLKRDLHNNNLSGASILLDQLLPSSRGDPDLAFEMNMLHVDYLIRMADYSTALKLVSNMATELADQNEDIFFRIKLLILKATILSKCGRPQRGFSVAMRAATAAWRARLLPALWHAIGTLSNILNSLSEFSAAASLLASILPRALECEDLSLSAQLFSWQVDSFMGLAGEAEKGSLKRTEWMVRAREGLERAFDEWSAIEDEVGMKDALAKKSVVARAMGDVGRSDEVAGQYLSLTTEGIIGKA